MDSVFFTKLISLTLYPLGLFFVLHLLAWIVKAIRQPRLSSSFIFTAWVVLLLSSTPWVASHLMQSLERQFPQQTIASIEPHDAILVLGGGLRIPQKPARTIQLTSGSDRYWHAAQLYKAGKAKIILVAGGNVFHQPGLEGEAYYAAQLLQQWGVPARAIKIETASRNTVQNIRYITPWLRDQRVNSVLLVTSAYHMPRALWNFADLDIKVTPASADLIIRESHQPMLLSWLPSVSALQLSTKALHEYYGVLSIRLQRVLQRD